MQSTNKKIVMFDFDGVLIDTLLPSYKVSTEVNEDMGIEEYRSFFDGNFNETFQKESVKRKYHPHFFKRYDEFTREIKIPDILKSQIKVLFDSYALVIISSTQTASINKILEREGIADSFKTVLGVDVHSSKVVKINMILDRYGVSAHDCVFVTDTLGDIREATACNVASIGVTWGFHTKENLRKGEPVAIVDDPRDLREAIQNVLK